MLLGRCTKWFPRSKLLSPIRFPNDEGNSQIPVECSANLPKHFISWEISGNFLRLEQPVRVKDARDFIMRQLGRIRSLVQLLSSHTSSFSRCPTESWTSTKFVQYLRSNSFMFGAFDKLGNFLMYLHQLKFTYFKVSDENICRRKKNYNIVLKSNNL